MPSLRKKVTTYFRQLSFIADRDNRIACETKAPDGSFISKYLDGSWKPPDTIPSIISGKNPTDLPCYTIGDYQILADSVTAAYTGPNEGLNGVHRARVHLGAGLISGPEIDFIDTQETSDKTAFSSNLTHTHKKEINIDKNANKRTLSSKKIIKSSTDFKNDKSTLSDKKDTNGLNKKIDHDNKNTVALSTTNEVFDPIANIRNWHAPNDNAYGISISLYEKNFISGEHIGDPVADCFGIIARENSCIMALADGVNWGNGARIAARCAVQGSIDYLNSAIFGTRHSTTTTDIFISLVRSFWEAHAYIMELGGALTTLTVLVVLPLSNNSNKSVVCCANVGDSLGYVYSKTYGVREITEGSHDVNSMRDMRDALGALGPVNGDQPEMTNFTLSLTIAEQGDIVFLTSDGVSDNFDPVVGKFAEPVVKRQEEQPSCSQTSPPAQHPVSTKHRTQLETAPHLSLKSQNKSSARIVKTQKLSEPSSVKKESAVAPLASYQQSRDTQIRKPRSLYMRSKTFIEPRQRLTVSNELSSNLPLVTGRQRHQLMLLRISDLLTYGIDGAMRPSTTAKQLCQLLIDFATCITSARRKLLEQRELYYKTIVDKDGQRKEIQFNKQQQKVARKRTTDEKTFCSLPGKLDHATIVAFTVGHNRVFDETNL